MYGQEVLVGWCVVLGGLALVGYGRSFAGVTRAQRMVREIGILLRPGRPEDFRATFDPEYGRHGAALPNSRFFSYAPGW
ncbi:hypothetical protein ACFXI8_12540 [Streptomyces niveus]|uniref:hypothetical protein n=1 Tax=Streptomyces niveus TaxID=193462 RepID=UPI0036C7237A